MSNIPKKRKITGNQGIDNFLNQIVSLSKPTSGSDFFPAVGMARSGAKVASIAAKKLATKSKGVGSIGKRLSTNPKVSKGVGTLNKKNVGKPTSLVKRMNTLPQGETALVKRGNTLPQGNTSLATRGQQGLSKTKEVFPKRGFDARVPSAIGGAAIGGKIISDMLGNDKKSSSGSFGVLRSDANTSNKQSASRPIPMPKPTASYREQNFTKGSATKRTNVPNLGNIGTKGSKSLIPNSPTKGMERMRGKVDMSLGSSVGGGGSTQLPMTMVKPKELPTKRTQYPTGYGSNLKKRK